MTRSHFHPTRKTDPTLGELLSMVALGMSLLCVTIFI